MARVVVLAGALLAFVPASRAQERPDRHAHADEPPPLGRAFVEFGTSTGGPAGWLGWSVGYLPADWLDARVGVGIGTAGAQVALSVGAHLPVSGRVGIGIDVGSSVGPYCYDTAPIFGDPYDPVFEWHLAWWGNVAVSAYTRLGDAFRLRIYVGYGRVLNPGAARCVEQESGAPCTAEPALDDRAMPFSDLDIAFFGAGLAYAFGG